jgi:hypothetical protein
LGVPAPRIDIDSFEQLRHRIPGAQLGRFTLGDGDTTDIFAIVSQYILKPYGLFTLVDKSTGKLSLRYSGDFMGESIEPEYVNIDSSLIHSVGNFEWRTGRPVGKVTINYRKAEMLATGIIPWDIGDMSALHAGVFNPTFNSQPQYGLSNGLLPYTLVSDDIEAGFGSTGYDTVIIDAPMHEDVGGLLPEALGKLMRYSIPAPTIELDLDLSLFSSVQLGTFVVLDWDDYPLNPFTAARGWSSVIGRVISTSLNVASTPTFAVKIELLETQNLANIAPAATVSAKGATGGHGYFTCVQGDMLPLGVYAAGVTNEASLFVAGDLIELRDKTGAWKENATVYSVDAATSRVTIVAGAVASAIATGDYITFQPCSASNTARMSTFSAYANATPALTGGDSVKRYA